MSLVHVVGCPVPASSGHIASGNLAWLEVNQFVHAGQGTSVRQNCADMKDQIRKTKEELVVTRRGQGEVGDKVQANKEEKREICVIM